MSEDRSPKAAIRDPSPAQRKSLSDEVLDRLRQAIVRGRLRPGHNLGESTLAEGDAVQEAVDLDMEFHDSIFRNARHNRLYSCWSNLLRSQIHAFVLSCSPVDPGYMVPCVPEHSEIRDALEDRDKDRAVDLIEQHLSSAHERMMQIPGVGRERDEAALGRTEGWGK